MIAEIATDRNITRNGILTYRVPGHMEKDIHVGCMVKVPLGQGNTPLFGYVVRLLPESKAVSDGELKDIVEISGVMPMLNEELVQLAEWVSNYYLCNCYYVLEYMLPKLAKMKTETILEWNQDVLPAQLLLMDAATRKVAEDIRKNSPVRLDSWLKRNRAQEDVLAYLEEQRMVLRRETAVPSGGEREEYVYESKLTREQLDEIAPSMKRAKLQWEILRYLTYEGSATAKDLKHYWSGYQNALRELMRKNLIIRTERAVPRFHSDGSFFRNEKQLTLNPNQQDAVNRITSMLDAEEYRKVLLHGVTGSGKTEVYLRCMTHALAQGKGVMVLVPEIALTPQLIGRFRAVLGESVEVFHSNMSDGERHDTWKRLYEGSSRVVVGVRSAVFAPLANPGLIIIDEEHETTFKQSEPDPRFHARTVAAFRMEQQGGILLLGSATPSVETYYEAKQEAGCLITLPERATVQTLPEVSIVDMTREFREGNRSIFSGVLRNQIEDSLKKGEQVILFLNRRGFSSAIVCRECGYTMECEKCSIALTYHRNQQLAKCHYCDYMTPVPKHCPNCGSRFIRYMGTGTELVEEEVHKLWPWVTTDRMDLDTTRNKNAHEQILERFAKGETSILIGTQMVTKGLDFPNVTTVGVMMADMTLNLPEYTAAERTFQLLTQVAGRAGRGSEPGHVVIQTYSPDHYSLLTAEHHDYVGFYEKEIQNRELMAYPPFSHMIRILVSDYGEQEMPELLRKLSAEICRKYPEIELLGPSEAPVSMIRKRFRFHLILKGSRLDLLREAGAFCEKFLNISRKSKTLRIIIDVEPQSVL